MRTAVLADLLHGVITEVWKPYSRMSQKACNVERRHGALQRLSAER